MPITISELDDQGLEARAGDLSVWAWFFRDWRVFVVGERLVTTVGWHEDLPDFDEVAPGANALVDVLQTVALSPPAPGGVKEALTQTVNDAVFNRLLQQARKQHGR